MTEPPPLPAFTARRPGLDQPRLPPTTLEDCPTSPRKTRTTCGNTRELMNKHPALVLRSIRFRPTLSISTGRCARCPSVLCAADACGGGAAVVPAIGDRLYRRALRQQGCEWLGHPLERQPGIFDAVRSSPSGQPFALLQNAVAWRPGPFRRGCHSTENHNRITIPGCLLSASSCLESREEVRPVWWPASVLDPGCRSVPLPVSCRPGEAAVVSGGGLLVRSQDELHICP